MWPLLFLLLVTGAHAESYLVFCPGNTTYSPWGRDTTTLCQKLIAGDVPQSIRTYTEERAALNMASFAFDASRDAGSANSDGKVTFGSLSMMLVNIAMPPELLRASFLGYKYPKVFLVELKPADGNSYNPVVLYQFGSAVVESVAKSWSEGSSAWSVSLRYDQLNYQNYDQDQTGKVVKYQGSVCFTASTNSEC